MKFEQIFTLIFILGIVVQFYYSFINGKFKGKDIGKDVTILKRNALKQQFVLILIVCIIAYTVYMMLKTPTSINGVLIIIYLLLFIYDTTKMKIISEKGLGNKSLNNIFYNFYSWKQITRWEWHPDKNNILFFNVKIKNKENRLDWEIPLSDRQEVESILNTYIKEKYVDSKEVIKKINEERKREELKFNQKKKERFNFKNIFKLK